MPQSINLSPAAEKKQKMNASQFFNLKNFAHSALFPKSEPVWSALRNLKNYINEYHFRTGVLADITNGIPLTRVPGTAPG